MLADPEIALPLRMLDRLAGRRRGNSGVVESVIGGTVAEHVSVMGYQDRTLRDWQSKTAPEVVAHLQGQGADGLILAPV